MPVIAVLLYQSRMNQTKDGMMRPSNYLLITALGIALVSLFPALNLYLFTAIAAGSLLLTITAWRKRTPTVIALASLLWGLSWGAGYGLRLLDHLLPPSLEKQPIVVVGEVTGLPELSTRQGIPLVKFNFRVEQALCEPACQHFPALVKLSWLQPPQVIPGQRWQLSVKLKRPHGFMNPGGFDYESWLKQRGFGATGYVSTGADQQRLEDSGLSIDYCRWQLSTYLDRQLQGLPSTAILKALLIADKRAISPEQWELFRRHGVIHLMVISGLHIGLVSGLVFGLCRLLLLVSGITHQPDRYAAMAAIAAALAYCLAAGASLPTLRALVMVSCVMGMVVLQRRVNAGFGISLALLCCLLLDPLAVISSSFWLSFGAVVVLLVGLTGNIEQRRGWLLALRSQWLVYIGLLPLLAFAFGEVSVDAPLVNLLFVPLFGLLVVPVNFLALAVAPLNDGMALALWQLLDHLVNGALQLLDWLDLQIGSSTVSLPAIPLGLLLIALLGVCLLLAPRGLPLRWWGALLLLPLFSYEVEVPEAGGLEVSVLDVGQGLSVVIRTAGHVLVYDVGARFPQDDGRAFVVAEAVLLPFLRSRGIEQLDMLVLSHNDNDHAGGWREVLAKVGTGRLISGEPLPGREAETCRQQAWHWDEVSFQFLATDGFIPPAADNPNNRSCVLLITGTQFSLLLPGDIDSSIEKQLISREQVLPAGVDVLLAPHHGSHSSSSWAFIKNLQPRHVVFSAGYRNQFGHPHPDVVRRYQYFASTLHNTSEHGSVDFHFAANGVLTTTHYRQLINRYWH